MNLVNDGCVESTTSDKKKESIFLTHLPSSLLEILQRKRVIERERESLEASN